MDTRTNGFREQKAAPHAKRLAGYALTGLAFNLVLHWLDVCNWSAVGVTINVLTFTCVATLMAYLVQKRMLPDVVLRTLDRIPKATPMELARGAARFVTEYPTLVLSLVAVVVWTRTAPAVDSLPATAQAIHSATYVLGVLWFVYSIAAMAVAPANVIGNAISLVERFILLSLAMVAVRAFGSELAEGVQFAKENPDGALAVVAACVVLRVVLAFVPSRNYAVTRGIESASYAATLSFRRARLPQDIHRTAVHEAGHVLMFGGRGELPADLAVTVRAEVGANDLYRGQVTHVKASPEALTEGYLRWSMVMYLTGTEAEHIALGERADGGSGDHEAWLAAATAYLSSGFGEVFYADPVGEAQREHNRLVLNALKAACIQEARTFLNANRVLLDELAVVIARDKKLNQDQLAPFIARVVPVELNCV